jgi:hypothetical protein
MAQKRWLRLTIDVINGSLERNGGNSQAVTTG